MKTRRTFIKKTDNMTKKAFTRIWQRLLIIAVMAALFILILQSAHQPILIFSWIIILLMFINFWYGREKEGAVPFFIGIIIMAVLMIISILSFIGWIFNVAMFNGFWAQIFGWPSLIWAFIIALYSIFMLDKDLHENVKGACLKIIKEHAPMIVSLSLLILLTALIIANWDRISETYSSFKSCLP